MLKNLGAYLSRHKFLGLHTVLQFSLQFHATSFCCCFSLKWILCLKRCINFNFSCHTNFDVPKLGALKLRVSMTLKSWMISPNFISLLVEVMYKTASIDTDTAEQKSLPITLRQKTGVSRSCLLLGKNYQTFQFPDLSDPLFWG